MELRQRPEQQEQEYRPRFQSKSDGAELMSVDQCHRIAQMDDSQLLGAPPAHVAAKRDANGVVLAVRSEVGVAEVSTVKRRRGRPPRSQPKLGAPPPPPAPRKKKDEEDVCFICFDGGSLVLCDRRGCPKAYHPACIKRDDAFFRSKAKWNCGWHICSSCQRTSHYMCYTCTFSLCKGCTKGADYVRVRGNMGFCATCMRTIMLLENVALGNKETVQVDFDDKTSFEYLFKVYWVYLKEKLSLTLGELTNAKNPWKGDELPQATNSWKGAAIVAPYGKSPGDIYHHINEKSPLENCDGNLEANHFKRRKTANQSSSLNEENLLSNSDSERMTWATKELLDFVSHMKNGDTSMLTQYDVQNLVLEYVKRNNLRDPSLQCQIVCDSRLMNLFGKARVGHIEMLKLLEYHFLAMEKPIDDAKVISMPAEVAENSDSQLTLGNDRRRKTRKKSNERGSPINSNPDEYAAIDFHNISLLYLKRSLIENLMDDAENFHEKVGGSFVRIRISGDDLKQDMFRLVQVVGTTKKAEAYNVGTRSTNFMLEILNLDKKEVMPIDQISNQDFSEDECGRLQQSIKCGLFKRLKVGEIQEKAIALRAVKVGDWIEAETLRLNHLHDRASENGRRKELRECVEKLELLKSPTERQRMLLEVPIIHADPTMDPSYDSEKDTGDSDDKSQGEQIEARNSVVHRKRPDISSDDFNNVANRAQKNLASCGQSGNVSTTFYVDRDGTTQIHEVISKSADSQGGEAFGMSGPNAQNKQVGLTGAVTGDWNNHASTGLQQPHSPGREIFVNDAETEKLWHYQDPAGKIHGPFPMMQLRKWSTHTLLPQDLRVWRINEKQENSILLTDALDGRFTKEVSPHNGYSLLQALLDASVDADNEWENRLMQNTEGTCADGKKDDDKAGTQCNDNSEIMRNRLASQSSSQTATVDVAVVTNDEQAQNSVHGLGMSKDSMHGSDQGHIGDSHSSPPSSEKLCRSPLLQAREGHGDETRNSCVVNIDENPLKTAEGQTSVMKNDEKQVDKEGHSSHSSGQNWRPPPIDSSSSGWDSKCDSVSVAKPTKASKQNQDVDFSDHPNPKQKQIHERLKDEAAENKQSVSSNVAVVDSGPSWSTASSVGRAQITEVAGEWGGYSSTPAKPIEEWDSNLLSASSLKPTEGGNDHAATPTSGSGQLTYSSAHHPAIDVSSWQSMVTEPTEFCSLADESVSDLLAEVEAMESLGGLPSPTSKMSSGGDLAPGSDNDCFSPVEGFSPAPDPGKSDALSSTGDVQMPSHFTVADDTLRLSHYTQLAVTDAPLRASQMPSQLTVPEEPRRVSHVPSTTVSVSRMPSQSTITDDPLGLSLNYVADRHKSFSGHSSSSAEMERDTKPSDVSVNQWDSRSEVRHHATSRSNQRERDLQPPTLSIGRQWDVDSQVQRPAPSMQEGSWGTAKGNINLNQVGVTQGNTNTVWGAGQGTVQQHANTNSTTSSANSGSWGSQPRHGGERHSGGSRDHRNYFHQGRDSSYGRDNRSMWNNSSSSRQPIYGHGVGNGGSTTHRPPPKGQRVCKFHENGYCKRGASCSFLHPSS